MAEEVYVALVGQQQGGDQANQGRFAPAVGSQHTEDLAAPDFEGQVVDRDSLTLAIPAINAFTV